MHINMASSGGNADQRHSHGPGASTQTGTAASTIDTPAHPVVVAGISYQHGLRGLRGRSSMEPGGLSRSPNLCLSYPATAQSQSNQASGQYIQGLSLHKLLAAAHYPAGLSQQERTPQSIAAFSYTCDHHRISTSASLHCARAPPSFPPLHGLFVCQSGIANCSVSAMCHRVYVPTTPQTASQANSPCYESLVWFKVSGVGSIINTGPSQRLALDILLLTRVRVVLQLGMVTGAQDAQELQTTVQWLSLLQAPPACSLWAVQGS